MTDNVRVFRLFPKSQHAALLAVAKAARVRFHTWTRASYIALQNALAELDKVTR